MWTKKQSNCFEEEFKKLKKLWQKEYEEERMYLAQEKVIAQVWLNILNGKFDSEEKKLYWLNEYESLLVQSVKTCWKNASVVFDRNNYKINVLSNDGLSIELVNGEVKFNK